MEGGNDKKRDRERQSQRRSWGIFRNEILGKERNREGRARDRTLKRKRRRELSEG